MCVYLLDMSQSQLAIPITLSDVPPPIAEMLNDEDCWEFNILELEAATNKRYKRRANKINNMYFLLLSVFFIHLDCLTVSVQNYLGLRKAKYCLVIF